MFSDQETDFLKELHILTLEQDPYKWIYYRLHQKQEDKANLISQGFIIIALGKDIPPDELSRVQHQLVGRNYFFIKLTEIGSMIAELLIS